MTDHSGLNLPIDQALTSDMMLGLKPSAPRSRSYRVSQAPLNGAVFNPGSMCIIELPTGRKGTWIDQSQSYLKFTVQLTATAAVNVAGTGIYLDNSAYSFIQRVDIYNQSNLLESINEYGQLANFLIDTSLTTSDKIGLSSIMGFNNSTVNMLLDAVYAQNNTTTNVQIAGDRSGQSLGAVINTAGITTAIPYVFALPFLSGVIGVNCSKMLPVGKLSNPIHIELYFAANDDAIYYGTAGAGAVWQISNVEFVACYVELTDDISYTEPGMPDYIATNTYRQANSYLPTATAGEFTTLLPFRCASLNAVYARFRNQANAVQGANGTAAYRKGSSINPNFGSYYFRIGAAVYPNKPVYLINGISVGTGSEGYAELLKSFHALSTNIGNSAIQNAQYNVTATAQQGWRSAFAPGAKNTGTQDTHNNAFAIGLELQTFSNRNDIILSGISTLNAQLFFTGIINSGNTAGGASNFNYTCDFFANMDMILIIQDGIMSAKY